MDDDSDGEDRQAILEMIHRLRQEHEDLDAAVLALGAAPLPDQLRIVRLKKRKLILKDQLAKLENRLTPDLIA
jgi:hypothetical protein